MVQQAWKMRLKHLHALVYKLKLCDSEYIESHKYISHSNVPSDRSVSRVMGMISKLNPYYLKNVLSLITMEIIVENGECNLRDYNPLFMLYKSNAEYKRYID